VSFLGEIVIRKFLTSVVLLCLVANGVQAGEVLRAEPGGAEYNLGPWVDVLEDPEGQFSISEVTGSLSDRFRASESDNPSFGFTSAVYWLRFTVQTPASGADKWYLVQRHPIIDHLTLFVPTGGGFRQVDMGDALPFDQRQLDHREFIYPVPASDGQPRTYYLRVSGKGALSLELKLSSAEGLIERTYVEQLVFGLFFGALVIMLVYNLLLYFSVRDRAYLYYIVFLSGFLLSFVNINGFGLQYLWPGVPKINEYYPVFATVALWGLVQYSRVFLDLARQRPGFERFLKRYGQLLLVMFVALLFLPAPWSYHLSTLLVLVEVVVLVYVGASVWRQGYSAARLFVLAWSLFLFGCVLFAADNMKLIEHTMLTNYAPHIGGAWAVILLSLALGDRIKLLEAQRDAMAREARETLQRHFSEVQRLDRDKMVFLDYLSHELNTPLNWLSGARMLEAGDLPDELREAVSMVHKGQDRLQQLVETSLRYFDLAGRKDVPAQSHCAPMWLFDQLMKERKMDIEVRDLDVRNRIPADEQVLANEAELRSVLAVLLDNAIQFSPDGARIEAVVDDASAPGSMTIRVCDEGKGILAEDMEGIFEPFFMVGSGHRADGFGLSLPIARVMVEQMGGQLWAESEGRGQGACLCLRLPRAAAA
jgi:signal transduction histidine kinase